ncbi:MAG: CAP domain-containing protein [Candidatus Acidiferrales bacterium]
MSQFTRTFALLAAILLMASGALFAGQPQITTPEGQLFSSLNRERVSEGLPVLQWDDALASAARQHAVRMAQLDQMSHQLPGEPNLLARASEAGAHFSVIAENVAIGPDPALIHTMWMHSPRHRANILSPQLTAVGIAVVQGSSGLFAAQDFSQRVVTSNPNQQVQQVTSLLAAHGLQATATNDAAASCDGNRKFAPNTAATLVRYETPNLDKLPDLLDQQLQTHKFRAATVAACSANATPGFSRFRVAVLLF